MTRAAPASPALALCLVTSGCFAEVWGESSALFPGTDSDTGEVPGTTTTTGETPGEPGLTGGVQTVTGPDATTAAEASSPSSSESGPPVAGPPKIEVFAFEPAMLDEAGSAAALLTVSGAVTQVEIRLDDEVVASGPPGGFAYAFAATSAKFNAKPHTFVARALDGQGGSDEETAELWVELPASGATRCVFHDEAVAVQSGIAGLVFDGDDLVAVGARDSGGGSRIAVWRVDPRTCAPRPGWPRSIESWTAEAQAKATPSSGAALAIDAHGSIALAGNLIAAGKTRPYVALLNSGGSMLWEALGEPGDQAYGVARAPWPSERIVMVGSRLTHDNPPRHDGLVIGFHTAANPWVDVLAAPLAPGEVGDDFNLRSEKIFAVLADPDTGEVFVVGEREFQPEALAPAYQRTFVARYYPDGGRIGTSTSSGDYLPHDSARSVKWCGSALLLGGWTRDQPPGSKPQPLVRWVDEEGNFVARRAEPLTDMQNAGVDCDREGKIIAAGTQASGGQTDADVYAFAEADKPLVWQAEHDGLDKANDGATGLACDSWGFCAWGGFETVNGKVRAIVKVHHP